MIPGIPAQEPSVNLGLAADRERFGGPVRATLEDKEPVR
jgi:hypothetical protein